MAKIKTLGFDKDTPMKLKTTKYGTNWPVVYIINNKKEAYVGQTTSASIRAHQHLSNNDRLKLENITIISNDNFNVSSALDLEAFLIKYMSADKKFKLQNSNGGLRNHNFYQKEIYENELKKIWFQLKKRGLVQNDLRKIENSDLFKFSPYKSLTSDQYLTITDILSILAKDVIKSSESTFLVHGGPGTGKTILAIFLIKLLSDLKDPNYVKVENDPVEQDLSDIIKLNDKAQDLNIALVIPKSDLRTALKKVFRNIKGLNPKMILSPSEVVKSNYKYDLLIVDEAHRLKRKKNITNHNSFKENNKKMNLDDKGTELDWILLKSKYQILFYDMRQTIRPSDVRKEDFDKLKLMENFHSYYLNTQLRCMLGGEKYIKYVMSLFSNNPPKKKINFDKYDFKIFENVDDMVKTIKKKNKEYGLCRNIAGYAWEWKSKKLQEKYVYDIEIDGYKYIWNSNINDWINSPNAINEIGSIHTSQGFDLNYTGLIIGNDLKYDDVNNKIIVDRNNYYDVKGKNSTTDEELLSYILNIYSIMCTRGILGTYIYVCDEKLRNYLKKYIDVA